MAENLDGPWAQHPAELFRESPGAELVAVHAELRLKAEYALAPVAVHAEAWMPEQKKDTGPAEVKK